MPVASFAESRTVTVVAGEKYAVPPGGQTWILGQNYRALWSTPIEVELLDLESDAGGLTPVRRVGGEETLGLALRGEDGKAYTFRSVEKDLTHVLPWFLRIDAVEDVAQDQLSATVPGVEVVVHPFARALGLIEPEARLVVLPDDPALGEFRETFAGRLGVFLEYPEAGFMGTTEIQDADVFWSRRQEDPTNRADSGAFLEARLLDLFLGDWDRHRRQWRWARVPGEPLLQPVPEDRDQVFSDFEGLAMNVVRLTGARVIRFEPEYGPIEGHVQNGWDVDRFILTDLDRAEWMAGVESVRDRLTDAVIEAGLRRLPAEYYELVGESLGSILRDRRDRLDELAEGYYLMLAEKVDVQGSNRDEVAAVEPRGEGVFLVELRLAEESEPYYRRELLREETEEIRIYLHGGDDRLVAGPASGGEIKVHAVGGPGDDVVVVDDGSSYLDFWDSNGQSRILGDGSTNVHTRAYRDPGLKAPNEDVPWIPSRDWGRNTNPRGVFGYHPDAGVVLGGGIDSTDYGFRKYPWSNRNVLLGAFAIGVNRPFIDYKGDFRRMARTIHLGLESRFSGLDQLRYYGLGNETENDGSRDPYEVSLNQFTLFPAIIYSRGDKGRFLFGPIFKVSASGGTDPETVLAQESPTGFGSVAQLGVKGELRYDSRVGRTVFAPGFEARAEGAFYPELWDIESDFGFIDARVDFHTPLASRLFLTLTAGGKKIWGDSFPFFEAAYLGGHQTAAGYNWNRFAGDRSLYGGADLKVILHHLRKLVPGELGISFEVDTGRVWLAGESSSRWHPSYGGSIFYAPFSRFALFEAGFGRSTERNFFIFRAQTKLLVF